MDIIQTWGTSFTVALQDVSKGVVAFLPTLIIAIIIFAIGWVFAALVEKLVESIFRAVKVDSALKGAGMEEVVKRAGYSLNSGAFVGALVKWFVIVVFLIASFDILHLDKVTDFLRDVVGFLPNVIIAVLVLMVAAVVANAMQKVVIASSHAAHVKAAELLGRVTKWSIWIFGIIIALDQLNVAPQVLNTLLMAILGGIGLAIGIAFGLGGKEVAARILDKTAHTVMDKE